MKPYILIIALIAIFLVPYGWVAQQSPALDVLFNQVFHSLAAHIIGHAAIFALIGALSLMYFPALRGRPAAYVALILLVALGQEGFQVIYKGHLYLEDTLGDLLVDMVAATTVWLASSQTAIRHLQSAISPKERPSHDPPAGGRG
ncbi:hypothetical protein EKD04_005380 [Chloroflexales bacterium ZM16-3]|nr:hypothetical protein [Chloroflexales bacterium ZM16-3]